MATSSYDSMYHFGATTFHIPAGVTNAVWVPTRAYLLGSQVRISAGTTAAILPSNAGSTFAAATLAATGYYVFGTDHPLHITGPASYYLGSVGATTTVSILFKYSQGSI